jgi:RNA polymerase sigma factor (sigma-70 family)
VTDKSPLDHEPGTQCLTSAFQRYRKAIAKLVARIVMPHDIEDIVQETYIRIYKASQKQHIFYPKSFMLRTARNLALNHVNRADAMNHLSSAPVESDNELDADDRMDETNVSESPETLLQAEEEFLLFCRSLRNLSLQCRRAFILRKVYGLSQQEVAKRLGISESTVEKHIAKGITAAGEYMQLHGYARTSGRAGPLKNAARGNSRHE